MHCDSTEIRPKLLSLEIDRPFEKVIADVLEYNLNGYGCLMTALVSKPFMQICNELEKTVFHLIQLGYDNNVDMDKVLNYIGNDGCSLFSLAFGSEKLTKFLIKKRVRANTIDHQFEIPCLHVSLINNS